MGRSAYYVVFLILVFLSRRMGQQRVYIPLLSPLFRRSNLGKAPPTSSFAMRPPDDEWGEVIPMHQVGVGLHIIGPASSGLFGSSFQ